MGKVPTIRPISWLAAIPQFAAIAALMTGGWLLTGTALGALAGCWAYLLYSLGSRRIVCRHHQRGLRLTAGQRYAEAIAEFEESYAFFARHPWIDRCRAIALMTPAALSYREMALINIAYCHGQAGDAAAMDRYYRRTLEEFPGNMVAAAALRMIDTIGRQAGRPGGD